MLKARKLTKSKNYNEKMCHMILDRDPLKFVNLSSKLKKIIIHNIEL